MTTGATEYLDSVSKSWFDAMTAKGHTPIMHEGRVNLFVTDEGHHNGPGCSTCKWTCCHHCYTIHDIPECIA